MAAVAWPYKDLGVIEPVSILKPEPEPSIVEPDFVTISQTRFCHNFSNQVLSQFLKPGFVTICHDSCSRRAVHCQRRFQVTIWTNPPRSEYFFKIWKYNSSNPKLSEVSSKERSSIWGYLSSLPPGGDVNRGFWHWNEWKSNNVRPNSSVSGSRTKVMKHANCTCLSCT